MDMSPLLPRVQAKIRVDADSGCWLWTAAQDGQGYGRLYGGPGDKKAKAHRYVYEWLVGPIPEGLVIDHLCRVRHCVNPEHLEPVTKRENERRGGAARRAAWTPSPFCGNGHPRNEANLRVWVDKNGRNCAQCRECLRNAYRARRAALKAA